MLLRHYLGQGLKKTELAEKLGIRAVVGTIGSSSQALRAEQVLIL